MASDSPLQVQATAPEHHARAAEIADRCRVPLSQHPTSPLVLKVSAEDAWLVRTTPPVVEWHVDFLSTDYQSKLSQRGKQDPLSRAIGLHKKHDLRVLDMSGGVGKDAFWLACLGANVTVLEQHPVLAYLLQQAVEKLRYDPQWQSVGERMTVIHTRAQDYLNAVQDNAFDVAYYDPMFEPRKKTALVKKDMQILQALLGESDSADPSLIEQARKHIPKVVVKRAKADHPLRDDVHHQIETKVTRFDVY